MDFLETIAVMDKAHGGAWALYDQMIEGIPEGPCVTDYALGTHWSYVNAESGMGVAFTTSGGAKKNGAFDMRGAQLRDVAKLAKSWCFEEASLGVAALNAWYSQEERAVALGATLDDDVAADANQEAGEGEAARRGVRMDAFDTYMPRVKAMGGAARVTIVGHFPRVERFDDCSKLVVLERKCRDGWDTPDPACEYVMPQTDFAFITGVTLINKTASRLLDLSKDACTVMVGPSVVLSPALFERGVESLSGSIVCDPEYCRFAVGNGLGKFFGRALKMCSIQNPDFDL